MEIFTVYRSSKACNTYVVSSGNTGECIIVDPGQPAEYISEQLNESGLKCSAVLLTHGHYDHIAGLPGIISEDVKVYMSADDMPMLSDAILNLSRTFCDEDITAPAPNCIYVRDGDTIEAAHMRFSVIQTPGHTPGGITYLCGSGDGGVMFSGDTLFKETVGRWDFPGGDIIQLKASVHRLCDMPDETTVYPGHGPVTSIGYERKYNFFCK